MPGYPSPGTNVDKNLSNAPATDGTKADKSGDTPKRGIRGASGGVFVGPSRINSLDTDTAHATGAAAGGVEDSTGYRKRDLYETDGGGNFSTQTRPTGRTAYGAAGALFRQTVTLTGVVDATDAFTLSWKGTTTVAFVAGTNMTSAAIETAVKSLLGDPFATVTGTTDAGPFIITSAKSLGGGVTVTEDADTGDDLAITVDIPHPVHESNNVGDGGLQLGSSARGVQYPGVFDSGADPVFDTPRPLIEDSDAPAEGTVGIINGTAKFTIDMHANDVTNYTGVEIVVFAQDADDVTQDGDFIGVKLFDSATEGDGLTTALVPALVAGTYNVYCRFIETDGNPGPFSARGTVVVS